ncbi:MAG: sigma 54-interacting transcriptional regulator [Deltaproteobacteria bacterium]|nr:sigma 54-interacting transcriptional regulator [Deltaproteobacteria bacterium]
MATLKLLPRGGKAQHFAIWKNITSIGAARENDIAIPDARLADHHAQVVFDGRDFNVIEVDRSGEIAVNGKRKRRARLQHKDRLTLGEAEAEFSVFSETIAEPAASGSEGAVLQKLLRFADKLQGDHPVQELLESLMDATIEVTSADKGFLVLAGQGSLEVRVARNVRRENIEDGLHQLSDSILRHVVEKREAKIVSDALKDAVFSTAESVIHLQLCSVMCAPLLDRGELLGLLYVGNDRVVNLFEHRDLELLEVFAAQASLLVKNALLLDALRTDNQALREELESVRFGELLGASPAMLEVFRRVQKVAGTSIGVLVTGETGTGKELIARELHRRSQRQKEPFVTVNCGAIPENLIESELFGHVKGAFTGAVTNHEGKFQVADGGTLFLDEIGELPTNLQVKLLRALQDKVVMKVGGTKPETLDIRVVAATNKDLEDEVKAGRFREDLFYRLNVVNILLPPLRERGEDIIVLAKFLLAKYAAEYKSKARGFTPNALIAMKKYDWPGNVRQLENRIKKAVVMCEQTMVGPEDLDLYPDAAPPILPLAEAKEDFQRRYVLQVLERNNGNRTKAAHDLGVDPRTIFRYLEKEDEPERTA